MKRLLLGVVIIVSLVLWGRVGWLLACRIADSTVWRVVIAVPFVAFMVKVGMSLALLVLRPRNQ